MKNKKDVGVDLFEDYELQPKNVAKIISKYSKDFEDGNYKGLTKAHNELEKIGYTFEFYLDGTAYDLRKIGQKGKTEIGINDNKIKAFKGGGTVGYGEIKKEKQKAINELFTKCGVFWAFSDKQFQENKTPLKEGEKYISIGGGGYMPKGNAKELEEGMKTINKMGKNKVKENNLAETEILYELNNHECFYTGDYDDVVDMFEGTYTEEQIRDVYNKHRGSQQYKKGGNLNTTFNYTIGGL